MFGRACTDRLLQAGLSSRAEILARPLRCKAGEKQERQALETAEPRGRAFLIRPAAKSH
jgi:hypothetical protein